MREQQSDVCGREQSIVCGREQSNVWEGSQVMCVGELELIYCVGQPFLLLCRVRLKACRPRGHTRYHSGVAEPHLLYPGLCTSATELNLLLGKSPKHVAGYYSNAYILVVTSSIPSEYLTSCSSCIALRT